MKNIFLFVAVALLTVFYLIGMDFKAITPVNWAALAVAAITLIFLLISIIVQTIKGKNAQKKLEESKAAAAAAAAESTEEK